MAVRFFGQYLLENGVIDAEQLLLAIAHQEKTNLRFGEAAIALGLLDDAAVKRIRNLQRQEDIRSGEAAVKLGLITEAQLEQVLRSQANSHVMIGEALIATGAVTREDLEHQLTAFKLDQKPYVQMSGVPADLDPSGLGRVAVDLAIKFLTRATNLQVKLVEAKVGAASRADSETYSMRVGFGGDITGEIAMRATTPLCARIAGGMAGDTVSPSDTAMVIDGCCEFLNVVGGNVAAALARDGKRIELTAPRSGDFPGPVKGEHMLLAVIGAPDVGEFDLAIVTGR